VYVSVAPPSVTSVDPPLWVTTTPATSTFDVDPLTNVSVLPTLSTTAMRYS